MFHKIQLSCEAILAYITINWQPTLGSIMSVIGTIYYIGILKINVVNKEYEGSWKKFFKALIKGL